LQETVVEARFEGAPKNVAHQAGSHYFRKAYCKEIETIMNNLKRYIVFLTLPKNYSKMPRQSGLTMKSQYCVSMSIKHFEINWNHTTDGNLTIVNKKTNAETKLNLQTIREASFRIPHPELNRLYIGKLQDNSTDKPFIITRIDLGDTVKMKTDKLKNVYKETWQIKTGNIMGSIYGGVLYILIASDICTELVTYSITRGAGDDAFLNRISLEELLEGGDPAASTGFQQPNPGLKNLGSCVLPWSFTCNHRYIMFARQNIDPTSKQRIVTVTAINTLNKTKLLEEQVLQRGAGDAKAWAPFRLKNSIGLVIISENSKDYAVVVLRNARLKLVVNFTQDRLFARRSQLSIPSEEVFSTMESRWDTGQNKLSHWTIGKVCAKGNSQISNYKIHLIQYRLDL